jgi:hypothetical protein
MHACKVQARETHVHETPAHETPAHQMYASGSVAFWKGGVAVRVLQRGALEPIRGYSCDEDFPYFGSE